MTVSSTTVKNSFSGDGSTTQFTYTFPINTTAELKVIERSSLGAETVKTLNSDYTVVDNGSSGGTVTFTSAPASGTSIVLLRDTNLTQDTDYVANDPFPAESHETALDKLTLQQQEIQEEIDRSLKLSRTNTMTSTEFTIDASSRANKVLGFDSTGELSVTTTIGSNRGNWASGTAYSVRDIVKDTSTNNIFMVNAAHTSSGAEPLTTNTNSTKYDLLVDAAASTTAQTAAATSATNAATSETNSAASAASALSHKNDAETAKTASETAQTAAETARTAAQTAQAAAESALDTFDDRFLGAKSSDPSVDNDGNALVDGALYFDTTNDIMKVYDLTNTQWRQLTLTSGNQTNVNTVAGQISPTNNIATVAGANSNITTVASDLSGSNNIGTVAGSITNVNNVGGSITNVNTVASNLSGVNSFGERYRVQAGVPSSSNDVGDLVFDTTANALKVFDGSSYALAGSSVNGTSERFKYVATSSQTTFSGSDANGNTLTYDVAGGTAFADIYLNGVKLDTTDFTATDGTSIVLASGAASGDILQVVSYGTFTLASFSAGNLTSGTINNDRLPSPTLVVKGDGSSTDGKLTLNCSQNSHGVSIQAPPHSAGQSYTLTLPQTSPQNDKVLGVNSSGELSFIDSGITRPTITTSSLTIAPSTSSTVTIAGTNFISVPIVEAISSTGAVTRASAVSFTSASSIDATFNLSGGSYHIRVENNDGGAVRTTNAILTVSSAPSFSTSAGSLGTVGAGDSVSLSVSASSDSAVTITETTSVLTSNSDTPATTMNLSLSSAGAITGTAPSPTSDTTYTFTLQAQDAEGQTTTRQFSITISVGINNSGGFN